MTRYHGAQYQRGRGLGSLLGSLFKAVVPAMKTLGNLGRKALTSTVAKDLGKSAVNSAMKTGVDAAVDLLEGNDVKEGFKKNVKSARVDAAQILRNSISKRKKPVEKTNVKRVKKSVKRRDIFDDSD
jgi:hypothetical protein